MTDPLAGWLAFLGTPDCTCDNEWRGLGILYGVSLGKGWVRVSSSPQCPHHAQDAAFPVVTASPVNAA